NGEVEGSKTTENSIEKKKDNEEMEIKKEELRDVIGQTYVVEVKGFFCTICHKFFKDLDSVTHCKSEEHCNNFEKLQKAIEKREAKRKAAEEAKQKAEEEAKKRAEEQAKKKVEEDVKEKSESMETESPEETKSSTDNPKNVEDDKAEHDQEMSEEQDKSVTAVKEEILEEKNKDQKQNKPEEEEGKEKHVSSELDEFLGPVDDLQPTSQENVDDQQLISSLVTDTREQENSELVASLSSHIGAKDGEAKQAKFEKSQEGDEDEEEEEEEEDDDADTSQEISSPSIATRNRGKARGRGRARGRGKRKS
ncbi:vicilin-like seed storage protein At2g18540, partial [Limulus polyphemus]|uniref:Vicilin-like seed storage protein At2g18540 n=1 Tax=Limulus polyphemus TaxID=6850 RepID=A0ABM1BDC0_LIMPO